MWNNAFNEDDPENAKLADEYGIVMGTSHQEPMLRALRKNGTGAKSKQAGNWNYNNVAQRPHPRKFLARRRPARKNYENIFYHGPPRPKTTAARPSASTSPPRSSTSSARSSPTSSIPTLTQIPRAPGVSIKKSKGITRAGPPRARRHHPPLELKTTGATSAASTTAEENANAPAALHLLPPSITTAARQRLLPVDQHQPPPKNLRSDVPLQTIRRRPHLDRQRRPLQRLRTPHRVFSQPRLRRHPLHQQQHRRLHPSVGRPANSAPPTPIKSPTSSKNTPNTTAAENPNSSMPPPTASPTITKPTPSSPTIKPSPPKPRRSAKNSPPNHAMPSINSSSSPLSPAPRSTKCMLQQPKTLSTPSKAALPPTTSPNKPKHSSKPIPT